jgi:hypothetical protein
MKRGMNLNMKQWSLCARSPLTNRKKRKKLLNAEKMTYHRSLELPY